MSDELISNPVLTLLIELRYGRITKEHLEAFHRDPNRVLAAQGLPLVYERVLDVLPPRRRDRLVRRDNVWFVRFKGELVGPFNDVFGGGFDPDEDPDADPEQYTLVWEVGDRLIIQSDTEEDWRRYPPGGKVICLQDASICCHDQNEDGVVGWTDDGVCLYTPKGVFGPHHVIAVEESFCAADGTTAYVAEDDGEAFIYLNGQRAPLEHLKPKDGLDCANGVYPLLHQGAIWHVHPLGKDGPVEIRRNNERMYGPFANVRGLQSKDGKLCWMDVLNWTEGIGNTCQCFIDGTPVFEPSLGLSLVQTEPPTLLFTKDEKRYVWANGNAIGPLTDEHSTAGLIVHGDDRAYVHHWCAYLNGKRVTRSYRSIVIRRLTAETIRCEATDEQEDGSMVKLEVIVIR